MWTAKAPDTERGLHFYVHNLAQRYHDKVALVHKGVWNAQPGGVDAHLVIQQDVDVYGAVVIFAVRRLDRPAELSLDVLRCLEHLKGRQGGMHAHGSIDETVGRAEAPRLGFNK